jgi:preprotein translocase subunit SecE
MVNPIQFLREAKNELFKVVWPTRREIIRITIAVIVISLVVAAFLGAVDFGLNKLINYVVNR